MLDAGVSTLNETSIEYVRNSLMPELSDTDASAQFTRYIKYRLYKIHVYTGIKYTVYKISLQVNKIQITEYMQIYTIQVCEYILYIIFTVGELFK